MFLPPITDKAAPLAMNFVCDTIELVKKEIYVKTYELLIVLKPTLDAEELDKQTDKVNELVSGFGGKQVSADDIHNIGRKKLAYEIKNFRDANFVDFTISLPADKVAELKRQLRLNDNILRTMLLKQGDKK